MKQLLVFIICFFCCKLIAAQPLINTTTAAKPAGTGNTYALIIGVAKYLDPEIPQLQFSNRDAEIFAEFLQSKAGGSVPKENIRLLVDSAATTGAVYDAVYWLKKSCHKDDNVYFYFSGHGDLENVTMYNNGFLICYDSPPFNYVKLALSIDYLNDIANTLSLEKQANVVLITDACHSGNLTEKRFKGNFLAGNQLRKAKNKEIRITSSSGDELSNEKEDWGGGRGVFSYYLVYGLKGLADKNNTGNVTVADIKYYLDSALQNDEVLKQDNIKQTPVVNDNNSNSSFVLSRVDSNTLISAKIEIREDTIRQRAMMVNITAAEDNFQASPQEYFFGLLKKKSLEALTDAFKLYEIAKGKIAFSLIDIIRTGLNDEGILKLNELQQSLKADRESFSQFNSRLATLFDAAGQQVITQYLKGDAAELEKRRYYNAAYSGYDVYPKMYAIALKLIPPDNKYYYTNIKIKLHYFTGVALRLKIPLTETTKQAAIIEKALAEQKKALALEEYAAYIYNEIGILYNYKNNLPEAEKYFKIAAQRAPSWAIPYLNLADIYADRGNLEKASLFADSAFMLQPDLQDIFVTYGSIYEKKAKMLQAEEAFQKSIKINDRNFIPFERLGYVYMNNMNYERADSMFYEAAERKKGFYFNELNNPRNMKLPKAVIPPFIECNIDSVNISGKDILGQFALGYTAYRDFDLAMAERAFKRVIALDNKNPLAYHYLGRTLYDQQRLQEAEQAFKLSIDNYLPDTLWTKYYDSLLDNSSVSTEFIIDPCSDSCFRLGYYDIAEDYLLMAQVYENWNHYSESEIYYRKLIAVNTNNAEAYLKLVNLFEKTGRYNDAENYLLEYNIRSNYSIDGELNAFYKRVTEQFPENADWYLKAGNFQYTKARSEPDGFMEDIKWIDPITRETVYKNQQTLARKLPSPPVYRLIPYGSVVPQRKFIKPKFKPYTNGIFYLRKAEQLLQFDELVLAGVNTKLGDLYNWQGLPDSAIYFYEAAVELDPTNAGIRNKLVEIYALNYRFSNALTQLDSLYKKREISYDKQLLLATYFMQDGHFSEAEKLLKDAGLLKPVLDTVLIALNAKLAMLDNKPEEAMAYFNRLYLLNKTDKINLYNMARLQATTGNKTQAFNWLNLAVEAGFNYNYVLKYDPALKNLRKDAYWKKMIKGIKGKEYFSLSMIETQLN